VVVARNREDRFLDKVPYITSPGTRVKTLITEDGVFRKEGPEFVLSEYFSRSGIPKNERINQIVKTYGWKAKVSSQLKEITPPTTAELDLLHSLDPDGIWTSK
jgi:hypothetical protein